MPPMEQPASSVAAAQATDTRMARVVKLVIGRSPDTILAIGSFKRHENSRGTAGVHTGSVLDEHGLDDTIADQHGGAGETLAHSRTGKVLGKAQRFRKIGIAVG